MCFMKIVISTYEVVVEKKKIKVKINSTSLFFGLFTNKSESCHYNLQQLCNICKTMNCNVKSITAHSGTISVFHT